MARSSQQPGAGRSAFNSAQPPRKARAIRQDNLLILKKTGDLGLPQGARAAAGTNETSSCLESQAHISTIEAPLYHRNKSLALESKTRRVSKKGSKKIAVPRVFETKMQRSLRTEGSADACDLQAECYSMLPRKHVMDSHAARLKQSSQQRELYSRN